MDGTPDELTWDDVDRLARALADRIAAAAGVPAFDRVVGIARGGLIPAVLVAAHLQVKRVETLQVRFYDGDRRLAAPELVGRAPAVTGDSGDPGQTLVVDEILDSGSTLRFLRERYPDAVFATLVARDGARRATEHAGLLACRFEPPAPGGGPVWTVQGMDTERWILFPWSPPEDREVAS